MLVLTWLDLPRPDLTCLDLPWPALTCFDLTWLDLTRLDTAWLDLTWPRPALTCLDRPCASSGARVCAVRPLVAAKWHFWRGSRSRTAGRPWTHKPNSHDRAWMTRGTVIGRDRCFAVPSRSKSSCSRDNWNVMRDLNAHVSNWWLVLHVHMVFRLWIVNQIMVWWPSQ